MKIIYLTKRRLFFFIAGLVILLPALFLIIGRYWMTGAASTGAPAPFYQGPAEKKQVSLAVNVDWGEEYLPTMLEIFQGQQVQATFFLTGRWTQKFPELARSIVDKGHEIGNHGFSHTSPNSMSLSQNQREIIETAAAIKKATGLETRLFAPPSGECQEHVLQAAAQLGYRTILWSVDTVDWQRPPAETILHRVLPRVHNGAIILMHPTKPTLEALPQLIRELKLRGYRIVPVSANIGQISGTDQQVVE